MPGRRVGSRVGLVDGEFQSGEYQILVEVDGETRATCSSAFSDSMGSAVFMCDDSAVELTQNPVSLGIKLPEFTEGASVSVRVTDGDGAEWTGSTTIQRQQDGLVNKSCPCYSGYGIGELTVSGGGASTG